MATEYFVRRLVLWGLCAAIIFAALKCGGYYTAHIAVMDEPARDILKICFLGGEFILFAIQIGIIATRDRYNWWQRVLIFTAVAASATHILRSATIFFLDWTSISPSILNELVVCLLYVLCAVIEGVIVGGIIRLVFGRPLRV